MTGSIVPETFRLITSFMSGDKVYIKGFDFSADNLRNDLFPQIDNFLLEIDATLDDTDISLSRCIKPKAFSKYSEFIVKEFLAEMETPRIDNDLGFALAAWHLGIHHCSMADFNCGRFDNDIEAFKYHFFVTKFGLCAEADHKYWMDEYIDWERMIEDALNNNYVMKYRGYYFFINF